MITGILSNLGGITVFNEKGNFLKTIGKLPKKDQMNFVGIHMTGTTLNEKEEFWEKHFSDLVN